MAAAVADLCGSAVTLADLAQRVQLGARPGLRRKHPTTSLRRPGSRSRRITTSAPVAVGETVAITW